MPNKHRILLVDDDADLLRLISVRLSANDYEVIAVNNAEDALVKLGSFRPHVLVTDLRMPGMDGATMLRKLKEENPDVMMILLTGHADFEFGGSQALQSGMLFKILNKPCPPQKLSAVIRAAIDEKNNKDTVEEKAPDTVL